MTRRITIPSHWRASTVTLLGCLSTLLFAPAASAAHAPVYARQEVSTLSEAAQGAQIPPPGTVVRSTANCEQAPAQSIKDRATYSDAELERYGLPTRTAAEPFEKWAAIVRAVKLRTCTATVTAHQRTVQVGSAIWAGNIANQATAGQSYTEMDLDYYVPCINPLSAGTLPDASGEQVAVDFSEWVGLGGGILNGSGTPDGGALVQTGVETQNPTYVANSGWYYQYWAFVENTQGPPGTNTNAQDVMQVSCGDHMYSKVSAGNHMYTLDITTGHSTGTWIYGYNNDHQTAEAIVERKDGHPLANFGSTTFYGVGITDNNQYRPMGTTSLNPVPGVPHDFSHMYQCVSSPGANCKALNTSVQLAEVKPIVGDPGDNPYDQYAVVYHNPW